MLQVSEKERRELVRIQKRKEVIIEDIDYLLKQLFEVKNQEKQWWKEVAKKYPLPKGVRHMVDDFGKLEPLKRKEDYGRKIL